MHLSHLILRIGAVLVTINALNKLPATIASYTTATSVSYTAFLTMAVLPLVFSFIIALIMWFSPVSLLKSINNEKKKESEIYDIEKLGQLLLSLIGVYIFVYAFSNIIYLIALLKEGERQIGIRFELPFQEKAYFISCFIELIIGFVLIYWKNFFTALLLRLKKERDQ